MAFCSFAVFAIHLDGLAGVDVSNWQHGSTVTGAGA
jgi:hypothetical protein